jgi:hypothetical protein
MACYISVNKRICASCSAAQMNFEVRSPRAEDTVYVLHKTECCKNGALSRISGPTEEVTRALKICISFMICILGQELLVFK